MAMDTMNRLYIQMYQNADESFQASMRGLMNTEIIKMSAQCRVKNCFLFVMEDEFKKTKVDRMIDSILESRDMVSVITLWMHIKKLNQDLKQLEYFSLQRAKTIKEKEL